MTEDEAKTKWCCGPAMNVMAARIASGKPQVSATEGQCIASNCMAWRWSEPKRTVAFLAAVQARMQSSAKPNFNKAVAEIWTETGGQFERVEGDCGLAGEPK